MNKKVVIVEDEYFAANHLKKLLQKNGYNVVAMFHDGETVLKDLFAFNDAIFLLDIQLSNSLDGVDIAMELDKQNIPFVFITANTEDGTFQKAITTNPTAYISKPFKELDVIAGATLAFNKLKNKISIDSGKETFLLNPDDVLYIKSDNVYVEVFTKKGSYVIRKTMKEIEVTLSENFKRCHKSFIINMNLISHTKGNSIFIDKLEIPISKTYRACLDAPKK